MPKKQKRQVLQKITLSETQLQSEKAAAAGRNVAAIRQSGGEFNPDYTYVKLDLKRIGTLAGFFIFVLIVLSFFLR